MPDQMTGGCACGRIRYAARVENDDAYLCHCRMCQRSTGGVSIAFKSMKKADVAWEHEPDWYVSSPIARRPYCRECGTPLGFAFPDSETMDLTVGSFDDPSRFRPKHHFGAESMHRAWTNTEGLTEFRTDEYKPVADRWIRAVGKLPDDLNRHAGLDPASMNTVLESNARPCSWTPDQVRGDDRA